MEAIRQSVRPKHQVLILKCFPKLPKNVSAEEIKPKGSELSYLLYYASSRRSKLTKVGTFLEKKTLHDLGKGRTAPVQITLLILNAFLNNPTIGGTGAQGFGLFAPYVLRIIRDVLKFASEAGLVEAAVPTWDSFCRHQDPIALSADSEFRALFAEVVKLWAAYATKEQAQHNRTTERRGRMKVGVADKVKLRMSGLQALKSTADSETLASESGRQMGTVIPVILQNLYDGDGDLEHIVQLSAQMDKKEKEKAKGRPSIGTIEEDEDNGDPRAAGRSVAEADRMADQEASVLALRCLKSLFTFENRPQVRSATDYLLRFTLDHRPNATSNGQQDDEWAIQLYQIVCTWIPVQDRFVALFVAVELLTLDPGMQGRLQRQLLLAKIISRLLAAEINLIGIAVIDVLIGFLRLMVSVASEEPASVTNGSTKDLTTTAANATAPAVNQDQKRSVRSQLIVELQHCISNLSVHVYYTDQISDMILSILPRMRPDPNNRASHNTQATVRPPSSSVSGSHGMVENGSPPMSDAGASSGHREDSHSSSAGFYFNTAAKREIALNAVFSILVRSNEKPDDGNDSMSTNRNPVPVAAWEGSQWILKDPSESVRAAYVKAFGAWLELELPKLTLEKALQEEKKSDSDINKRKSLNSDLARRAATTASARKAAGKRSQTVVLQSIHLMTVDLLAAAQEPASEHPDSDSQPRTAAPPTELRDLAAKLDAISSRLELMDLEEFRSTQLPSLPLHLASPKTRTLSPHQGASDSDDAAAPSRQPSSAASFSRPPHAPRTRSTSAARRSPSLAGTPRSSARQDFATFAGAGPPGGQVEELKRLLSASASKASLLPTGAGSAAVAKRALSIGRHDDAASESMVEFEGSWAGSSFLIPERGLSTVDVRALLEALPSGDGEGEGGGPPVQ